MFKTAQTMYCISPWRKEHMEFETYVGSKSQSSGTMAVQTALGNIDKQFRMHAAGRAKGAFILVDVTQSFRVSSLQRSAALLSLQP